jgi:transcriptional regulator with XRE-family HTH domain
VSSQTAGHSAAESPADRISREIRERGLTNLQAALRVGVAEKTVWRWRKGDTPALRHAHRLADVFGGDWTDYSQPDLEEAA